jgi:hypothetical protein
VENSEGVIKKGQSRGTDNNGHRTKFICSVTIVVSYSGLSFFDCPFGLRYSLTFIYYKKQIIRNTVIKHFVDIGGIDDHHWTIQRN